MIVTIVVSRYEHLEEGWFVIRINGTMICLTCAIICHALQVWQTGVYKDQGDFKPEAAGGEPEP